MAKRKTGCSAAPVPKSDSAPPAPASDELARLPDHIRAAIDLATRTGRYYIAVIRLDTEFRQLNLDRYIHDIPKVDFERIATLLRDDIINAR